MSRADLRCRGCHGQELLSVLDLGEMPLIGLEITLKLRLGLGGSELGAAGSEALG